VRITKRQLKRIIKEEVSRAISESSGSAYDRVYAKYDKISDMHSMIDGANALANDLTDDQYNQMDGYTQDLDWDEQLGWINDNHPEWLDAIAATLPKEKKKRKRKPLPPIPKWWDWGEGRDDVNQWHADIAGARYFDYLLANAYPSAATRYQDVLEGLQVDGLINVVDEAIKDDKAVEAKYGKSAVKEWPDKRGMLKIVVSWAEAVYGGGHGDYSEDIGTGEPYQQIMGLEKHYFTGKPASEEEASALSEIIKILTHPAGRYRPPGM